MKLSQTDSRVDNKLLTRVLAREAGIAVPDLIGVVKTQGHVRELKEFLKDDQSFERLR